MFFLFEARKMKKFWDEIESSEALCGAHKNLYNEMQTLDDFLKKKCVILDGDNSDESDDDDANSSGESEGGEEEGHKGTFGPFVTDEDIRRRRP